MGLKRLKRRQLKRTLQTSSWLRRLISILTQLIVQKCARTKNAILLHTFMIQYLTKKLIECIILLAYVDFTNKIRKIATLRSTRRRKRKLLAETMVIYSRIIGYKYFTYKTFNVIKWLSLIQFNIYLIVPFIKDFFGDWMYDGRIWEVTKKSRQEFLVNEMTYAFDPSLGNMIDRQNSRGELNIPKKNIVTWNDKKKTRWRKIG